MIEGVEYTPLQPLHDERGFLMEILRSDDEGFTRFGQCYVTAAYSGVVKAWHYHTKQTDTFCVLHGMAKVVLYDAREQSPTAGEVNEFFLGELKPARLRIPAGVYHGFKSIGADLCLVLNLPDQLYDYDNPDEYRVAPHSGEVPYDWERRDG